jgi:rhomboid protease GluP
VPPQIRELQGEQGSFQGRSGAGSRQWLRIALARPTITPALLVVLVAVYLLTTLVPAIRFPDINNVFVEWGATQHYLIEQGEWWRLITATFLHAGFLHILLNGYALYVIGMDLEGLVGRARFAAIYAISGLAGSVASFAFSPANVSGVGASGAIFGLVGALGVYFGLHRRLFGRVGNLQFWNIIIVIVLNLAIGFSHFFPIDNAAHVGGLLAGAAVGYVLAPRYTLGPWAGATVRNLVNTNKGPLPWIAAALLGLLVVLIFITFLLLFREGILLPTLMLGQ